jgi:hypothetical protein
MKELKPFASLGPLKKALDNGGRFYNFFDAANDAVVSRGELAKAAGVFSAGITAFLYLQMTSQDIEEKDRETVLAMLDTKLRREFNKKKPPLVQPSLVDADHKAGSSVIVTGYAREIAQHNQFVGFITVPVMVGNVFVPIMIPVHDLYSVFEIFDSESMQGPCTAVCAAKKNKLDLSGQVQFGGFLKELKNKTEVPPSHPVFLEAIFWMKR